MTIEISYLFKNISDYLVNDESFLLNDFWYSLIICIILVLIWVINMSFDSYWKLFRTFFQSFVVVTIAIIIHKNMIATYIKNVGTIDIPVPESPAQQQQQTGGSEKNKPDSFDIEPQTTIVEARKLMDDLLQKETGK